MRSLRAKLRQDAGVLVVEAAFAFPIFLLLLFGIVDLGFAEFQTSQATSAARDGARVAILSYTNADNTSSADYDRIRTQVMGRLVGQSVQSITVTCLDGLTGSTTQSCSTATPDQDRVRVTVTWSYNPLTPVMAAVGVRTISGTATMAILGLPTGLPTTTTTTTTSTTTTTATTLPGATTTSSTTTSSSTTTTSTPPGACTVVGLSVNPALPLKLQNRNSTDLKDDTTFTVTTNGAATCTGLKIQLPTMTTATTTPLTFGGGTTWTKLVHESDYDWAEGTNLPLLIQNSSGTTLTGGAFTVSVTS